MNDLKTGGQTPEEWWMLYFEDRDVKAEMFTDEAAAMARYEQASVGYACHLFVHSNKVRELESRLSAHAADRAMLETREANAESYTLLLTDYTRVVAERDALTAQLDATKTVAFQAQEAAKDLVAQLDAARRERDEEKRQHEIYRNRASELWDYSKGLESDFVALRAELEARESLYQFGYAVNEMVDERSHNVNEGETKLDALRRWSLERVQGLAQLADLRAQLDAAKAQCDRYLKEIEELIKKAAKRYMEDYNSK